MHYQELYFLENVKTQEILFLYGFSVECDYEEYPGKIQKIQIKDIKGKTNLILLIKKSVAFENQILNKLYTSNTFTFTKENKEVIIVDPAFSAAACQTFMPAIENHHARYTIVTCVHSRNPDTGKESTLAKERDRILSVCKDREESTANEVTIFSAGDKGKPLFHDRFIMIRNIYENLSVYSLSHSINEQASGFPLYIHELEKSVAVQVSKYILDLTAGIFYDVQSNLVKFDQDIIWQKRIKVFPPNRKKRIFDKENEPVAYPFWDVFWGCVFGVKDRHSLLHLLKEKAVIKMEKDKWEWNKNLFPLLEKEKIKKIEIENQVPEFVIGCGETIARSSNEKRMTSFFSQFFNTNGISLLNKEILNEILQFYKTEASREIQDLDIHYRSLFNSHTLDFSLIKECIKIINFPGFIPGYYGLKYLFGQILITDSRFLIKWISGREDFIQFYSFVFHYFVEHLLHVDVALISVILEAEKPVFKALGCAYLLWQLDPLANHLNKYNFTECRSLLIKSGYADEDILWILSMGLQSTLKIKKKEPELYIEYLTKLAGLYKNNLTVFQKKQLIKAISRPRLLMKFAEILMDTYEEKGKVLFLWENCVEWFKEKIKQKDFYIIDQDFERIEIAARAFLNLHGFDHAAPLFLKRFGDTIGTIISIMAKPFYW